MELVTREYKTYNFNELTEIAKEKALNHFRESNVDYEWWDFLFENFKEELEEKGISFKNCYFEFYRSRFLYFTDIDINDLNKFIKALPLKLNRVVLNSLLDGEISLFIRESRNEYNYFDLEDNTDNKITENKRIKKHIDLDKLNEWFKDYSNNCLKRLYDEYCYLSSDEYITEEIELNEYKFLENGELF